MSCSFPKRQEDSFELNASDLYLNKIPEEFQVHNGIVQHTFYVRETATYRKRWEDHVDRMGKERWPKVAWNYTSIGRYVKGSQESLEGLLRHRYWH